MPDEPLTGRQLDADVLSPADAAMASRVRDFGEMAVRPFDAARIVAIATVGSAPRPQGWGAWLRRPTWPSRSTLVLIGVLLAAILAAIVVVVGSQRERPTIVDRPSIPPTTAPSQLAVAPSISAHPSASPAPGPAVLGVGRITYSKDGDVYVADLDGGNRRKILSGGSHPYDDPQWSGNGRISLTRDASDAQTSAIDIELTDAEGSKPRKVGHAIPGQGGRYHRWSPDGTRLAMLDRTAINILQPDGTSVTLPPPAGERWDVSDVVTFSWAPDGTALLAGACRPVDQYCDKGGPIRLMLVPVDGSQPRELAPYDHGALDATFSPDGSRIAFIGADSLGFGLSVMDATGSNRRVLVPPDPTGSWTFELTYAWSPDGRSIAFHHTVMDATQTEIPASNGLWVVDPETGARPRIVTSNADVRRVHAWSPDGRWILVNGPAGDAWHLAAVDVLTGAETVLADGTQDGDWSWGDASSLPSMSPGPRSVATRSSSPSPTGDASTALVYLRGTDVVAADLDGSHPRVIASEARTPSLADSTPDFDPIAVSSDGRFVAYLGAGGIDVVTLDGRHLGSISTHTKDFHDRAAMTWAEDSQRLAIYSDGEPDRLRIVRADGHELSLITLPKGFKVASQSAPTFSWSPDGQWIAISGCRELCPRGEGIGPTQDDILLVAADGSGSHWLNDRTVRLDAPPVGGQDAWADWSRDSRLAVSRDCNLDDAWCSGAPYPALQITGTDGVGGSQVSGDGLLGHVAWSPDGTQVAITSWTPAGPSLVIHEPDGAVTSVPGIAGVHGPGDIHWAPDGESILVSGANSIWSVPLDGGPAVELVAGVKEWFAVGRG